MAYLAESGRESESERERERESERKRRAVADRGTFGVNENHDGGGRRVGGRGGGQKGEDC